MSFERADGVARARRATMWIRHWRRRKCFFPIDHCVLLDVGRVTEEYGRARTVKGENTIRVVHVRDEQLFPQA